MTCEQASRLLGAYLDGEMTDIVHIQELEEHVGECASCTNQLKALTNLSRSIRESVPAFDAPASLELRVLNQIGQRSKADSPKKTYLTLSPRQLAPILFAACMAIVLVAGFYLFRTGSGQQLQSELVASHIRSLQASHLFDVPSSDRHTVKPWFQGKIDFSPSVPDLKGAGFPLLGGRLDYVNGHPAAALVYGRGKHVINVFVMRLIVAKLNVADQDGFHLIGWASGDLEYWAVSDVSLQDLSLFAKEFQSALH